MEDAAMKLLPKEERRWVRKKSQSIRWMGFGAALMFAETVLAAVGYELLPGPRWAQSMVIGFIFVAGYVARFLAAQDDEEDSNA